MAKIGAGCKGKQQFSPANYTNWAIIRDLTPWGGRGNFPAMTIAGNLDALVPMGSRP
jgi:hypothetical protein